MTLPNLIKELQKYRELSNFKINPVKSEILKISMDKKEELALQIEFSFTWGGRRIIVKLTAPLGKLYQANYIPLLNKIKTEIRWEG